MERFKGKVAVVTGAASGIGEAIVIEFLKRGLIVVALDQKVSRLRILRISFYICIFKIISSKNVYYEHITRHHYRILKILLRNSMQKQNIYKHFQIDYISYDVT